MSEGPFAGLRVIEVASNVAGPYCAKLLADLGADVLKVEPPGGDPSRQLADDPERSPLFLYCNTSKRGMTLDLEDAADRDTLAALLASADSLVTDIKPQQLPLADAANLLITAITPYGLSGTRCDVAGGELTLGHAGGLYNLLPVRCRDVDRAPVKLGGNQVGYHGGLTAALATGALLLDRRKGHVTGGLIDVSLQDVMLSLVAPNVAGVRYHDSNWSRVPDRPPSMGRLQTSDGYLILNAFDDHHFALFRKLMGNPDWCAGDEWLDMAYRTAHLMEFGAAIDAWALEQERDDLYHRAAQLGIPCGPINDAGDVMSSAQFESRGYFVTVEHPRAGTHRYAGWPYRMSRSAPKITRAAPLLGQHNEEVQAELERPREEASAAQQQPISGDLPLAGVRVLEFAWVWAGPYCGVLLSMLGAEVIKVEGPKRLDLTRRSVIWPRAAEQPSAIGPEEGMAYNTMNLNKRSVTLDLSQAEGRELARRLAASCDVVYDNMRSDALTALGLGYDDLRAVKEDLIVASSSGRGHGGPESKYLGYAMVHQSVGGGSHISGYPDDHPSHSGGDVDLMNAITLAFSIVAALHHRAKTGEGQFIDYSQCEACSSLLGEVLLDYEMTGKVAQRMGNAHVRAAPHSVYRCWGVDRWLAIEVHTDQDFRKLTAVMGAPELADDSRFATVEARHTFECELNEIIGAWVREHDRDWLANQLNAAGIAAAPSRDADDLYADSHLRERGSFVSVEHPDLGPLELVGAPFQIRGLDLQPRYAPRLGEHNDLVLGRQLGLTADELAGYRERNVIT